MRFLKSKRAEKELQMIFGLFILLIISLVVLSLFFKFTEKSTGKLEGASTEYFTKAELDKAKQQCLGLCEAIVDDNTLIEFCKKTVSVDWNGDKTLGGKERSGKWEFCEEMIPCFILVDKCQGGKYDGEYCRNILLNPDYNNLDIYAQLSAGKASDKCGLCAVGATVDANKNPILREDGYYCDPKCSANWRCKFGFFSESTA